MSRVTGCIPLEARLRNGEWRRAIASSRWHDVCVDHAERGLCADVGAHSAQLDAYSPIARTCARYAPWGAFAPCVRVVDNADDDDGAGVVAVEYTLNNRALASVELREVDGALRAYTSTAMPCACACARYVAQWFSDDACAAYAILLAEAAT